jgi:outer membrane protein assembly factor BamD (BamD/ComL family)
LMDAEAAFDSGEFLRAARSYEAYLQSRPQSNEMDRVRFQYGVAQSLSGVTFLETASNETFRQLIRDFPESAYVPPARMALALQADIQGLKEDKAFRDDQIRQLTALLPPVPPLLPAALAEAESAYDSADFATAAKSYEAYLQSKPQADEMDRILLRLGVSQSLSGVTAREAASNETFNKLIRDYPNSPYAASARRVLALRADILRVQQGEVNALKEKNQKLVEELDNIKKVDSQRRRTP